MRRDTRRFGVWFKKDNQKSFFDFKIAILDSQFWQALGKALGWGFVNSAGQRKNQFWVSKEKNRDKDWERQIKQHEWKWQAHQYFDLVLTGNHTEKFWKELLTGQSRS